MYPDLPAAYTLDDEVLLEENSSLTLNFIVKAGPLAKSFAFPPPLSSVPVTPRMLTPLAIFSGTILESMLDVTGFIVRFFINTSLFAA